MSPNAAVPASAVDRIPAPLLSRQLAVVVIVLSVLAAAALLVGARLGPQALEVAVVIVAVQQAFLALAVAIIGRTGLAGRHTAFPVVLTLGTAAVLLLDALAEVVAVILALAGMLPPLEEVVAVALGFAAVTGVLVTAFGVVVLRAGVVRPGARALPLVAGLAILGTVVAAVVAPDPVIGILPALAVLLSGGIALALFTPRTLA